MAVSLFLALSRRLQAPASALLILAAVQLASAAAGSAPAPVTSVRASLAAAAQIAPERS